MIKVTEDDLLEALRGAFATRAGAEGLTVGEMRDALDQRYGVEKIRKALLGIAAEGRLDVLRVMRPSLDGRLVPVAGYRIRPKAKK